MQYSQCVPLPGTNKTACSVSHVRVTAVLVKTLNISTRSFHTHNAGSMSHFFKKKRDKQALAPSSVTVNTAVLVGSHKPSSVEFGNHLEMPSADRSVCRQIIGVFASETEIMVSVAELSVLQAPLSLSLTLFFFCLAEVLMQTHQTVNYLLCDFKIFFFFFLWWKAKEQSRQDDYD